MSRHIATVMCTWLTASEDILFVEFLLEFSWSITIGEDLLFDELLLGFSRSALQAMRIVYVMSSSWGLSWSPNPISVSGYLLT